VFLTDDAERAGITTLDLLAPFSAKDLAGIMTFEAEGLETEREGIITLVCIGLDVVTVVEVPLETFF
jgi:hypothetical protein